MYKYPGKDLAFILSMCFPNLVAPESTEGSTELHPVNRAGGVSAVRSPFPSDGVWDALEMHILDPNPKGDKFFDVGG